MLCRPHPLRAVAADPRQHAAQRRQHRADQQDGHRADTEQALQDAGTADRAEPDLQHHDEAQRERQRPRQRVPVLHLEQVIEAEPPADHGHRGEDHRARELDDTHRDRCLRRLVVARPHKRSLDQDHLLALEVYLNLLDVAVLRRRAPPGQFGLAVGEGARDHFELVSRRVEPVGFLDRLEAEGDCLVAIGVCDRSIRIAGGKRDQPAFRIEADRVVAGRGFETAGRLSSAREARPPIGDRRAVANRLTGRRESGHFGDLIDVQVVDERDARAWPRIRIAKALDSVARLCQHAALGQLQRQIRARPREVVVGHRDAEHDHSRDTNSQCHARHAAHRCDFNAVVGEFAFDDDVRIRPGIACRRRQASGLERGLEPLQIDAQVGDRLIAEIRILLERLFDDPFELQRQPARHRSDRRGFALENRDQQIRRRRRGERRPAGHQLVEHDAEGVTIRSPVDGKPARLFRGHVGNGADDGACARLDRRRNRRLRIRGRTRTPRERGDAEVEHLHVAVGPQHQVVGLDVAMDDRRGMRGRERRCRLDGDVEDLAQRQRAARDPLAQRLALDELRDEES